uniref:ribosomal protein S8 n=1 Tax=Eustigmatophyceae sp. WTwin 8/9 T-6m6.8 TaxID=2974615 RepID=UPI0021822FB4|nr:ribosomal protein S8 [Eustigmatophyceae sp. WTwin 8/9 T-6m6.8]UVI60939.1 ribosomal protein S8 [Eustigmatophyceae sp. WTwin 8/9 T-6m6.8]
MTNDTISDMLTRLRNGNLVGHKIVKINSTRINYQLIKLLRAEGLIRQYETVLKDGRQYIFVYLKYSTNPNSPIIRGLKRVSKPGLRVYVKSNQIPMILGGQGLAILSTSKGIMTNQKAKELGIGGELLFYIW